MLNLILKKNFLLFFIFFINNFALAGEEQALTAQEIRLVENLFNLAEKETKNLQISDKHSLHKNLVKARARFDSALVKDSVVHFYTAADKEKYLTTGHFYRIFPQKRSNPIQVFILEGQARWDRRATFGSIVSSIDGIYTLNVQKFATNRYKGDIPMDEKYRGCTIWLFTILKYKKASLFLAWCEKGLDSPLGQELTLPSPTNLDQISFDDSLVDRVFGPLNALLMQERGRTALDWTDEELLNFAEKCSEQQEEDHHIGSNKENETFSLNKAIKIIPTIKKSRNKNSIN